MVAKNGILSFILRFHKNPFRIIWAFYLSCVSLPSLQFFQVAVDPHESRDRYSNPYSPARVGMMTGGKFRFFLGMVRRMNRRNCNRMVLMVFRMAVFVLAFWVVFPGCGVGRPCW